MLVTLSGIVMLLRPLQPKKAKPPILVTPDVTTAFTIFSRFLYQGAVLESVYSHILPLPEMVSVPSWVSIHVKSSPQVPESITSSASIPAVSSTVSSASVVSGTVSSVGTSSLSVGASAVSSGISSSLVSVVSSSGTSSPVSSTSSTTSEASVTSSGSSPAPSAQTGVMSWKVMVRARNMANSFFMTVPSFRASPLGNGDCFSLAGGFGKCMLLFYITPSQKATNCLHRAQKSRNPLCGFAAEGIL